MKTSNHGRYVVKSLVHATRVIEAFQSAGDVLRLRDVVIRTGFSKGMCFRLLYTLHQCGFLDKVGENHYRSARASGSAFCPVRVANTRLIASVAYFPEKYGDGLLRLALDILARKAAPPAVFTTHQVITPENVDHFYPNDSLLAAPA